MKLRWKILIGLVVVLAALLAINAVVVGDETKDAEITVDGGQILELPSGDVQVVSQGPAQQRGAGVPIVMLHSYTASLHWFDRLVPLLAKRHRVIRVDLLGFGGSEKPTGGYEIPEQAALVAGALNALGVQGAVVVGHSMGFTVATALADQSSQLVDRVVNIDSGPDDDYCSLGFRAMLAHSPVLGEALWRVAPDAAVEDGVASEAFAPGYDVAEGFPNPDQLVDDYRAMTFTSFEQARSATDDYRDEIPLDDRLRQAAVPVLSIFGSEDQICDPEPSQRDYETVPGARTTTLEGVGHSPQVEAPEETAELIERFAAEAEVAAPRGGRKAGRGRD